MLTPSRSPHPGEGQPERPNEPELLVYEIVAFRRMQYDALMWQVPALSLTAQAFLLTISFGADSSAVARLASSLLAAVTAVISVQLMGKHRWHETIDSRWLERFESERAANGARAAIAACRGARFAGAEPAHRPPVVPVVAGGLGAVAGLAFVLTLVDPSLLR